MRGLAAGILPALLALSGASPAAADAQLAEPAPATAHVAPQAADWMADPIGLGVRALDEGARNALLVGEETPTDLTIGMQLTQAVLDVEGDGDEELLQVRGSLSRPKVTLADGLTGEAIWSFGRPDPYFLLSEVPRAGGGRDLLLFEPGPVSGSLGLELHDGVTGALRWTRSVGPGNQGIGYFGVSDAGSGYELVMGAWDIPLFQLIDLNVEYISLDTGKTQGSATITGEGQSPTVALAGDLDEDGIGDLFALEGNTGFGAASGGQLFALTDRGQTELWSTLFLKESTDFSYLIGSMDATGDGVKDALIWSEFLGAPGVQTNEIVSVVNGAGGPTAGLRPVVSVDLDLWVHQLVLPGDINGDGKDEAIFSGAILFFDGRGAIAFEAVSGGGTVWYATPDIPGASGGFGYDWNSSAGDLDGDGVQDALVLMAAGGVTSSIGVSQSNGATLWRADSSVGAFDLPVGADLDGDGADDMIHAITGSRPTPSTIRVDFEAASGRNLTPLWQRSLTLNAGSGFYFNALGGYLDSTKATGDVVVEYTLAPSYSRHFAECLSGADGSVLWTS